MTDYYLYKWRVLGFKVRVAWAMPVKSKLHILSLQKDLKQHKPFLKSIANSKTPHQRRLKIKQANKSELKVLQRLLCAFSRQDIGISKHLLTRLKQTKKHNFILTHFQKLNSQTNLKNNLLKIASVLHLFLKLIFKKPSAP